MNAGKGFNMRTIKKILAIVIGSAILLGIPGMSWSKAELVLSETNVDFGNLVEGVVAEKVVELLNSGDQPLKITNVTTS